MNGGSLLLKLYDPRLGALIPQLNSLWSLGDWLNQGRCQVRGGL